MNIQEIITLIRSGSRNPDHREGQRQTEKAIELLKKVQAAGQWLSMETAPKDGCLRKAPWADYNGNELFEGDVIEHPNGERGRIEFHCRFSSVSDQWRVDYGEGALSRLCLQIGDKGRAVKVSETAQTSTYPPHH